MDTTNNTSTETSAKAQQIKDNIKSGVATAVDKITEESNVAGNKISDFLNEHNITPDNISEKTKDITAKGLEGISKISEKIAGSTHHLSEKLKS